MQTWRLHDRTFMIHRWVCSTNWSSMMSPGGVGFVFTGTSHPQLGVTSVKLASNSAKPIELYNIC